MTKNPLSQALEQFDQPEKALGILIEVWRATRDAKLAAIVEQLGTRVKRPDLETKPADAALKVWLACEKKRDDADLDRLLRALQVGTVKQIIARLETLTARAPDPRLTSAAAKLLETQPFRSGAARPIYKAIIGLLEAQQDPRSLSRLDLIKQRFMPGKGLEGGTDFRDFFTAKIDRAQAKAKTIPPGARPLGPDEVSLVTALGNKLERASAGAKDAVVEEEALLAAVWARPDDDAARQVYADFLTERGRAHGEFIALQLAESAGKLNLAGSKRMKELLKQHSREFLGPLQPAITLTNLRFECGFVAHCELADKMSPEIKALETHPAWSTVKSFFAFTGAKAYPKMIAHLRKLGATGKGSRHTFLAQFK